MLYRQQAGGPCLCRRAPADDRGRGAGDGESPAAGGRDVIDGRCLCGAVTVRLTHAPAELSACHCDMCRRWSGSVQMGLAMPVDAVQIAGSVKSYRSSSFSERAWCEVCGSALWLRNVEGPDVGTIELCPGLFDNAVGARLVREVYADRCPDGYRLAGDHPRISRADYERDHPFVEDAR
ncbi:GFA family protein [Rhodobacteraceae bacterium CCMM004]|nr:GFA family protein [Rhodobacteraceae bacterium CCMM004]